MEQLIIKNKSFRYFLNHPFMIYLFLLPVYTTNRLLGEDIVSNLQILPHEITRIKYYIWVFLFSGVGNLLVMLMLRTLNSLYSANTFVSELTKQRMYSVVISLLFIVTTYFIFYSNSYDLFLLMSAAHYFCIAFFGNMAVLETKYYNHKINSSENNYIKRKNSAAGTVLINFLGLPAIILLSILSGINQAKYYGFFCVALEVLMFVYIFLIKGYFREFCACFRSLGKMCLLLVSIILFFFALSMITAVMLYNQPNFFLLILPISLIYTYHLATKISVGKTFSIFSVNFTYSIIAVVMLTSVPLFLFYHESAFKGFYTHMIIGEKITSITIALIVFALITTNRLKTIGLSIRRQYFLISLMLLALPLALYFSSFNRMLIVNALGLLAFFFLYSVIEVCAQYVTRREIISIIDDSVSINLYLYSKFIFFLVSPIVLLSALEFFCKIEPSIRYAVIYSIIFACLISVILGVASFVLTKGVNNNR